MATRLDDAELRSSIDRLDSLRQIGFFGLAPTLAAWAASSGVMSIMSNMSTTFSPTASSTSLHQARAHFLDDLLQPTDRGIDQAARHWISGCCPDLPHLLLLAEQANRLKRVNHGTPGPSGEGHPRPG